MSTEADEKVASIINNIKSGHNVTLPPSNENKVKTKIPNNRGLEKESTSVRGRPKSGRFWKTKKDRFSSVVKTKGIRPDFQKKTALRIELKNTRKMSQQLIEQIKSKEVTRKERRRENIKRNEENKRKSEVVQVITNSAKLKRMKKKQLRFIEKRDVNKDNNK